MEASRNSTPCLSVLPDTRTTGFRFMTGLLREKARGYALLLVPPLPADAACVPPAGESRPAIRANLPAVGWAFQSRFRCAVLGRRRSNDRPRVGRSTPCAALQASRVSN